MKSKITRLSKPTASKMQGTNYSFIELENNDKGAVFFKTAEFSKKVGEEIEYELKGEEGRRQIKLLGESKSFGGNNYQPKINNRLEALKLAVDLFIAGKCEKTKIRETTKYFETILSE